MGPLDGVRVLELAGLGAAPFGCMVLADLGADVLRIDRPGGGGSSPDLLGRGRRSLEVDLKDPDGVTLVLELAERADVLVEGFRPGVAERLGVGPDVCLDRNARLVYARLTGWGQDGPLAPTAGHDIDYIAVAGALDPIGRAGGPPVPPLNLVGDFGGGGLLLCVGVLAALHERERSGRGQVVDAAMVDGAALLTTMFHVLRARGLWRDERGSNLLDTGAPYYDVYETSDGRYVAVGALEPEFYARLLATVGIDPADLPSRDDPAAWPEIRQALADVFRQRTRDEWSELFAGVDACVAPVLSLGEAPSHPHNQERGTFVDVGGVLQPAPAPRFSRTPAAAPRPASSLNGEGAEILAEWGMQRR